MTTRVADPAVWAPAPMHPVGTLDVADAAAVLADHTGAADPEGAQALAERLGGFPLALTLAGKVMAAHRAVMPFSRQIRSNITSAGRGLVNRPVNCLPLSVSTSEGTP